MFDNCNTIKKWLNHNVNIIDFHFITTLTIVPLYHFLDMPYNKYQVGNDMPTLVVITF